MITQSLLNADLCDRLCLTLAHSLWQSALLAATAFLAGQMLRQRSVRVTYAVQLAALAVCVVLLPLTFALMPVRASRSDAVAPAVVLATQLASTADAPVVLPPTTAETPLLQPNLLSELEPTTHLRFAWNRGAAWLVLGYALGVVAMLMRLARSVSSAERLRRSARQLTSGSAVVAVQRMAIAWKLRVAPKLAQAESIAVPTVVGLLRPTIMLPAAVLTGLTQVELELILAHELAHVRRGDIWVNLFQRLAEVALFFNPSIWYLNRRIDVLREYCCDELACGEMRLAEAGLATTRLDYAKVLVRVAEIARPMLAGRHDLVAMAASGRTPSELRRRVARLLGEPMSEPVRISRGAFALGLLFLGLTCSPMLIPNHGQAIEEPAIDQTKLSKLVETGHLLSLLGSRPKPGIATFNSGAQAVVLAVGTHQDDTGKWWNARGESLPDLYTWSDKNTPYTAEKKWRLLIFRLKNLPEGAATRWKVVGARVSGGGTVRPSEWKLGEYAQLDQDMRIDYDRTNVYAVRFNVDEDQKSVDLRVDLAHGEWKTVESLGLDAVAVGGAGNKSIVSSGVIAKDGGALIVVSHNYFEQEFRLIAIGKDKQLHDTAGRGGASAGNIYQCKAMFPGLSPEKIDHLEFQVRDYEQIELKSLPLAPVDAASQPKIISTQLCAIDPDGDCQFKVTEGKLNIVVPSTWHDLTYTDDYTKLNAPRVLMIDDDSKLDTPRPIKLITGDFVAKAKIEPFKLPSEISSGGAFAFASAGLMIWQDAKNFIRIERATLDSPFIWFERFADGHAVSQHQHLIEDAEKATWLRVTRAEGKFTVETSADGKDWSEVIQEEDKLAKRLQAGVSAINTTTAELSVSIQDLTVTEGAQKPDK